MVVVCLFLVNTLLTETAQGLAVQTPCAPIASLEMQYQSKTEAKLFGVLFQIFGESNIDDEVMRSFITRCTPPKTDDDDAAYTFELRQEAGMHKEGENWIIPATFEEGDISRGFDAVVAPDKTIIEMREVSSQKTPEGSASSIEQGPPKGAPATLVIEMHEKGVYADNAKSSKELATPGSKNRSLRTVQRELPALLATGLAEKKQNGRSVSYHLKDWLKNITDIDSFIMNDPVLSLLEYPILTEEEIRQVAGRVKEWQIIGKINKDTKVRDLPSKHAEEDSDDLSDNYRLLLEDPEYTEIDAAVEKMWKENDFPRAGEELPERLRKLWNGETEIIWGETINTDDLDKLINYADNLPRMEAKGTIKRPYTIDDFINPPHRRYWDIVMRSILSFAETRYPELWKKEGRIMEQLLHDTLMLDYHDDIIAAGFNFKRKQERDELTRITIERGRKQLAETGRSDIFDLAHILTIQNNIVVAEWFDATGSAAGNPFLYMFEAHSKVAEKIDRSRYHGDENMFLEFWSHGWKYGGENTAAGFKAAISKLGIFPEEMIDNAVLRTAPDSRMPEGKDAVAKEEDNKLLIDLRESTFMKYALEGGLDSVMDMIVDAVSDLKKAQPTGEVTPFVHNIKETEGLAFSFRNKLVSMLTTRKVILAFEKGLGDANSSLILEVFEEIKKLKKDPKYKRFLKNLIIINAPSEKLAGEIGKHMDKNTEAFLFARSSKREDLKKIEPKVHSTYIDESEYEWDMYYPLVEMVTIALSQRIDPDTIKNIKTLLKDLNIAAELPPDGTIIFKLLPPAERYDKQDLIKKYAALKRALIAA